LEEGIMLNAKDVAGEVRRITLWGLLVNVALSVREGHRIGKLVKERLLATGPDVVDVLVHVEPDERGGTRIAEGQ
jgi:divalent metal cation (Fe/Co/Zn/Cd) transporter